MTRYVQLIVLVTLFGAGFCFGQQQPALQITSPADGTIVNPGNTVGVSVSSPNGTAFSAVGVVGTRPIVGSSVAASLPAQFTLTIPSELTLRKYAITAMGITNAGDSLESDPIGIDVERPTCQCLFLHSQNG
jgi:hypothetical protein